METRNKTNLSFDELLRLPQDTIIQITDNAGQIRVGFLTKVQGKLLLSPRLSDSTRLITNSLQDAYNKYRDHFAKLNLLRGDWWLTNTQGRQGTDYKNVNVICFPSEFGLPELALSLFLTLSRKQKFLSFVNNVKGLTEDDILPMESLHLPDVARSAMTLNNIKAFAYNCGAAEFEVAGLESFNQDFFSKRPNLLVATLMWVFLQAMRRHGRRMLIGTVTQGQDQQYRIFKIIKENFPHTASGYTLNSNSNNLIRTYVLLWDELYPACKSFVEKNKSILLAEIDTLPNE